jgi:hypothetical protein
MAHRLSRPMPSSLPRAEDATKAIRESCL